MPLQSSRSPAVLWKARAENEGPVTVRITTLIACTSTMAASAGQAEPTLAPRTLTDLLPACQEAVEHSDGAILSRDAMACTFMVIGAMTPLRENCDALRAGEPTPHNDPPILGRAGRPSLDASLRALVEWATSHPDLLDQNVDAVLPKVLAEAFPCPTGSMRT